MSRPSSFLGLGMSIVGLLGLSACVDEVGLASEPAAIENGDVVVDGASTPAVQLSRCSATMIASNWVLTAKHCVNVVPDHAFGVDGKGLSRIPDEDASSGVAGKFDAQGRLVVAANVEHDGQLSIVVLRYLADGRVDPTFGSVHRIVVSYEPIEFASTRYEWATDLAIDGTGRIVVVGSAIGDDGQTMAMARLLPDGALDRSFDGDGKRFVRFTSTSAEHAQAVAIDSANRIVIAGGAGTGDDEQMAMARLSADGTLDRDFDEDGKVLVEFGSTRAESCAGVTVDSVGRIVCVGAAHKADGSSVLAAARVLTGGGLDRDFDEDGKFLLDLPGSGERFNDVASLTSGAVVAVGQAAFGGGQAMIAARLNRLGQLDRSFAGDGIAEIDWSDSPSDAAEGVVVDRAGRITLAGSIEVDQGYRVALARLTAAGQLDPDFSNNGQYNQTWSENLFVHDLALSPDDHLAVTGSYGSGDRMVAVGRYNTRHTDVPGWPDLTAWIESGYVGSVDRVFRHPTRDVTLLRLDRYYLDAPVAPLYQGSLASLDGKTLSCFGYGDDDLSEGTGFGTLRSAQLVVSSVENGHLHLATNGRGQNIEYGDSGGACFLRRGGSLELVGVHSSFHHDGKGPTSATDIAVQAFSDWVFETVANH